MDKKISQSLKIIISLLLLSNCNYSSYAASPFSEKSISISASQEIEQAPETTTIVKSSSNNILNNIGDSIKNGYSTVKTKLSQTFKPYINEAIFLPGHESKEMVCQGIAYLPTKVTDADKQCDGSYCQYILLSYYPMKNQSTQPSQIVVIDRKTAEPVKRFALYESEDKAYTGHAGGIAVAGKYLWVASGNKLYGFNVQEIIDFIGDTSKRSRDVDGLPDSMDKLPGKNLICEKTYSVDSKASYVSFDGKYLWVGDFTKSSAKNYKPIAHHNIFKRNCWIAGYLVDSTGYPTSTTTYTYKDGDKDRKVNKPDAVIAMRESVQGMAVCGDYLALTISYGATNSKLAIYNNPLKEEGTKKTYKPEGQSKNYSIDAWELADKKNWVNTVKLPAGAEDLEYDGENLYVTFECSSKNYSKWKLNPLVKTTKDFYLIDPKKAASEK